MISQLLSLSKTPSAPGPEGAQPTKSTDAAAPGAFSLVLSMLGGTAQGEPASPGAVEGVDDGEGEIAEAVPVPVAIPGVPLPDVAAPGKILPDAAGSLPDAAGPSRDTSAAPAPVADTAPADPALAMLALVAPRIVPAGTTVPAPAEGKASASAPGLPAGLPLPAQQLAPAAVAAAAPASVDSARPAAQPAVAIQVAPLPAAGEDRAPRDPALATGKPQTDSGTTLQPNTASAERPPQRDLAGGERPVAEPAAKAAGRVAAEAAPMQPMTPAPAPAAPAAAVPVAPAADAAPTFAADRPAIETGIARELSRIVDSLASAREAMVAKGATLALDHAEFGELSLRFDQRRDGQLGVQIAAADPDAHRAVAAAVADRPAFAQPDASQQNTQAGGSASARGALADREGGSGEGHSARHERHEERRRGDTDTNHTAGKRARGDSSAIYA